MTSRYDWKRSHVVLKSKNHSGGFLFTILLGILLSVSRVGSTEHVYTNTIVPPFSIEIYQPSLTNGLISWSNVGTNTYSVEWSMDLESWFPLNAQPFTTSVQTVHVPIDFGTDRKMFRVKRIIKDTYVLSGIILNSVEVLTNYPVRLIDQFGQQELASTTTDFNGEYTFPGLANGNYLISTLHYNSTNSYFYSFGQVNGSDLTVNILTYQVMTLTSPTNNSVGVSTSHLFTWGEIEYADWYSITIYNRTLETLFEWVNLSTNSYQSSLTMNNNQVYEWYVSAYDSNTNIISSSGLGSVFTTAP